MIYTMVRWCPSAPQAAGTDLGWWLRPLSGGSGQGQQTLAGFPGALWPQWHVYNQHLGIKSLVWHPGGRQRAADAATVLVGPCVGAGDGHKLWGGGGVASGASRPAQAPKIGATGGV
jgi:hypothetical protein